MNSDNAATNTSARNTPGRASKGSSNSPGRGGAIVPGRGDVEGEVQRSCREVFRDGLKEVLGQPKRVREVIGQMPVNAKCFLLFVLLADLATVTLCFWKQSPDQSVFRLLVIAYVCFQYTSSFHAVYTQNEYTLVASIVLFTLESTFVTIDWNRDITGYSLDVWEVVAQWTACIIIVILAKGLYSHMEGFGWKPYRELGARQDRLAVHTAYRKFTALLSFDFFSSFMLGLLSVTLVTWPTYLTVLNCIFCISLPWLASIPLKRAIKNERLTLLKTLVVIFTLGGCVEVALLVFSVFEQTGDCNHSRIKAKDFPVAPMLIVSASVAWVVRVLLLWKVWYIVDLAFGNNILHELGISRKLHRDAYSAPTYGAIGSTSHHNNTKYDYYYRVVHGSQEHPSGGGSGTFRESNFYRPPVTGGSPRYSYTGNNSSYGAFNSSVNYYDHHQASVTHTPSLGPVPILTAKAVTLNEDEEG